MSIPPNKLEQVEFKVNGDYKNLEVKPKPRAGFLGIPVGTYIEAVKEEFQEAMVKTGQYGDYAVATFTVDGDKVSMFLSKAEEWEEFNSIGLDQPFAIYYEKYEYTFKDKKGTAYKNRFTAL
jgi:hypothetical protein